jgi:hypothetical protein
MTPDDVRAAAERLVDFHERFAPLFGKEQAQDHAYDYLKGLMVCPERKSIEPIALNVGHGDVSGLQKFVGAAPWADDDVMAEAQALFAEELVPSAAGSPVGVIDESAFTKKGAHSAGVARQHNGRLGKEDDCQVGVHSPEGQTPFLAQRESPGTRRVAVPVGPSRADRPAGRDGSAGGPAGRSARRRRARSGRELRPRLRPPDCVPGSAPCSKPALIAARSNDRGRMRPRRRRSR